MSRGSLGKKKSYWKLGERKFWGLVEKMTAISPISRICWTGGGGGVGGRNQLETGEEGGLDGAARRCERRGEGSLEKLKKTWGGKGGTAYSSWRERARGSTKAAELNHRSNWVRDWNRPGVR